MKNSNCYKNDDESFNYDFPNTINRLKRHINSKVPKSIKTIINNIEKEMDE